MIALPVSFILVSSELLIVKNWLYLLLGVGVVGVLSLHVKSFFATEIDDLGFYYSRLYGMFFSFCYTSLIFIVILALGGTGINPSTINMLLVVVLGFGFYNFLCDNYFDMTYRHLLAKELVEKNNKKD